MSSNPRILVLNVPMYSLGHGYFDHSVVQLDPTVLCRLDYQTGIVILPIIDIVHICMLYVVNFKFRIQYNSSKCI